MEFKLADWLNHPIVREAHTRLATHPHTALDLLTETMRVMHELDERFPGATTAEILRARGELPELKRAELRERMLAAGAKLEDVQLVAPLDHEIAFEAVDSRVDLAEEWEMPLGRAKHIVSMRQTPNDEEREAAHIAETEGLKEARRRTGRPSKWLARAVGRVKYDRLAATVGAGAAVTAAVGYISSNTPMGL